jgi:hypothetical protein
VPQAQKARHFTTAATSSPRNPDDGSILIDSKPLQEDVQDKGEKNISPKFPKKGSKSGNNGSQSSQSEPLSAQPNAIRDEPLSTIARHLLSSSMPSEVAKQLLSGLPTKGNGGRKSLRQDVKANSLAKTLQVEPPVTGNELSKKEDITNGIPPPNPKKDQEGTRLHRLQRLREQIRDDNIRIQNIIDALRKLKRCEPVVPTKLSRAAEKGLSADKGVQEGGLIPDHPSHISEEKGKNSETGKSASLGGHSDSPPDKTTGDVPSPEPTSYPKSPTQKSSRQAPRNLHSKSKGVRSRTNKSRRVPSQIFAPKITRQRGRSRLVRRVSSTPASKTSEVSDAGILLEEALRGASLTAKDKKGSDTTTGPKRSITGAVERKEVEIGEVHKLESRDISITPLDAERPPVPNLFYGLDRVLFKYVRLCYWAVLK